MKYILMIRDLPVAITTNADLANRWIMFGAGLCFISACLYENDEVDVRLAETDKQRKAIEMYNYEIKEFHK